MTNFLALCCITALPNNCSTPEAPLLTCISFAQQFSRAVVPLQRVVFSKSPWVNYVIPRFVGGNTSCFNGHFPPLFISQKHFLELKLAPRRPNSRSVLTDCITSKNSNTQSSRFSADKYWHRYSLGFIGLLQSKSLQFHSERCPVVLLLTLATW